MRSIHHTYDDPLSLVWVYAAEQMGMRVERSAEVNASWNGAGVLTIGTLETLDPDDSLAQMILHETCHALVEGPECLTKLDWGLPNHDRANQFHEHACLRLQAALADQIGLRAFFASTTMFRNYYDALPNDPLADGDDMAIPLAQVGWQRAKQGPWAAAINEALQRTAQIARALDGITTPTSLWHNP